MRRHTASRLLGGALVMALAAIVTTGLVFLVTIHATPDEPGAALAPVRFGLFGLAAPDDQFAGRAASTATTRAIARSACRLPPGVES